MLPPTLQRAPATLIAASLEPSLSFDRSFCLGLSDADAEALLSQPTSGARALTARPDNVAAVLA